MPEFHSHEVEAWKTSLRFPLLLCRIVPVIFISRANLCKIKMLLSRLRHIHRRFYGVEAVTAQVFTPVDMASKFTSNKRREDILQKLRLDDVQYSSGSGEDACKLRLLKNSCLDIDAIHMRRGQPIVYYHRLSLLLQRIQYLKSVGLTPKEKLRSIQKQPPALIVAQMFNSNFSLAYLSGISMDNNSTLHLFCPLRDQILANRHFLQRIVDEIKEDTGVTDSTLLKMVMSIPCYTIDNMANAKWKHMLVHRYLLPRRFILSRYDLPVLPVMTKRCNLMPAHLCSNGASESEVGSIKPMDISDVLDYSYLSHHGAGTPASLTDVLDRMERAEAPLVREKMF